MNNKIYIADTYLHYDLQNELLMQNNHQPLVGIQIVDFYAYLETFTKNTIDSMRNTIEIYNRLQSVTDNLFEPLLENVSFIQEIQSINEELSKNKCTIHELPNEKQSQKSLYELLSVIQDIPTKGKYLENVYTKLSKITDFSNITFVNFTYPNTWEQTIYEYMIEHGAKFVHTHIPTQNVEYHFALNKRLECESVAQKILELVNNDTPLSEISIMVSDLTAYKDTLAFVMSRYNIPLYIPNNTKVVPICDFLECLFNYYAKPNQTTFKNLISNTFFHTPHCESLFSYADALHFNYEDYFTEFNYSNQLIGSPFLSNGNDKTFIKYEENAKIAQTHYTSFFNQLDSTTFIRLLDCLYTYLSNNEERLQTDDIKLINKLYETFYELAQRYPNQSISFFALTVAQWLKSTDQRFERLSNQIIVCDLHTPPINKTYGFLLGMHQKGYPAFHNHSGLLNEELIAQLPNFLSLSTRYDNHMSLITKNIHFAKYLYISYPQSNYEGKTNEHSLEIEMEFNIKDPTIYPLQEGNHSYHRTYQLNPELAKELFFADNIVNGSISRFEKYFNCPYQYFLNSGIRIKSLFSFKIKESELGTLQHAFLENMVKAMGKEYPKASNEDIQQFLDTQFKNYETVFRKDSVTIDNLKQQIKLNLQDVLDNLNSIEQHTSFRPKETEYYYDVDLLTYKDITLHINGIIDRIDEIAQGIRIIDYKSSKKTFDKKKFQSGQMLQLITYAYMASMLLQKEVFGVYYYSMQPCTTKHIAGKVAARKYSKNLESYEIVSITQQEALDSKDFNILYGNTFVTDTSSLLHLDDSAGEYGSDIKKGNKDQIEAGILAKIQNPFTFEEAKEQLILIYQYLIDQLLNGEINCTPTENACTYCEYSSICMYKGEKRKHAPIIIQDESEVN